ncbi:MAG: tetratricopeptide repeat protein [Candidatus Neomarinimicrobiota bacterium]
MRLFDPGIDRELPNRPPAQPVAPIRRIRLSGDGVASKLTIGMLNKVQKFITALLLLLLVPVYGQDIRQDEQREYDSRALSHYLDADLFMMQGEYRQAVTAYELTLRYDSTSATIYLGLAEALMKLERHKRAAQAAQHALKLQPDDPNVHELLSRNALAREDYKTALHHLDEWARLDPSEIDPLFRKASILIKINKIDEAVDTYLEIADRDHGQTHVLPRAGEIALSMGYLERAYQVYKRLNQQQPEDNNVARTFAEVSLRTGRNEEALTIYEHLVEVDAASTANRMQLAWLYTKGDKLQNALELLGGLIEGGHRQWEVLSMYGGVASELDNYTELAMVSQFMRDIYPDSINGYTGLAIARSYLDDLEGAIAVMEDALTRFPMHIDVNYLLGRLYFDAKRYLDAEKPLLRALDRQPSARYIKRILASAWSSLEKFKVSDSLYEELLKVDGDDAVALNNYAYSIADRPNPTKKELKYARKLSRRSLKIVPDSPAFLDTYGWIWYRLGRYRQARKYVAQSLEIDGNNAVVTQHLGQIFEQMGDREKAEEYFSRASEIREKRKNTKVHASDD